MLLPRVFRSRKPQSAFACQCPRFASFCGTRSIGAVMASTWAKCGALADRRLAAVELKFYNKAVEGDGDPQSAIVFVKTSERRATLAGANAPIGHAVTVMHQAAPARELTSTQ